MIGFDGDLVEFVVRFDRSDVLGKVLVIEESKFGVFTEEGVGVNFVGVGEKDESMAFLFELANKVPHGGVEGENVFPGSDESLGSVISGNDLE